MKDTYRDQGLRKKMIKELQRYGGCSEAVLSAMQLVPRHFFLPKDFYSRAYLNIPTPIGEDQTISQPLTVALQTTYLKVEKRQTVLEVGTGSGYQASVLAALGARVFTVERQEILYKKTKKILQKYAPSVRCFFRDGSLGLPEFAPYDRILVTAGATEVPDALLDQLKVGGILVIPVGEKEQRMLRFVRKEETKFTREDLGAFAFVPLLSGVNKKIDDLRM